MAKEYLQSNGRLLMTSDGELVQVPDSENLNDLADTNSVMATQSETTSNEIEDLIVNCVIDGSPRGVYANLSALQTAYPSGAPGVYVTTDNGHWYYWNGTAWTDGGVYQGIEPTQEVTEAVENINKLLYGEIILDMAETANNAYRDSDDNLIATYYASKSALSQANKEIANLKEALYGYVLDSTDVEINSVIPYTTTIGSNTYNLVDNAYGLIKEIRGNTIVESSELHSIDFEDLAISGSNLLYTDKTKINVTSDSDRLELNLKSGTQYTCWLKFKVNNYSNTEDKIYSNVAGGVSSVTADIGESEKITVSVGNTYLIKFTFTTPSTFNKFEWRLLRNTSYGGLQINADILEIGLFKGSTAPTTFKPHKNPIYILRTLMGTILRGVGNVKDKIVITKNTDNEYYTATKITNVGEVDLGSLNFTNANDPERPRFYTLDITDVRKPSVSSELIKGVAENYEIKTEADAWSTKSGLSINVTGMVVAYGTTTPTGSLAYELATPTTEVISSTLTDSDVMPLLELGGIIQIENYWRVDSSVLVEMVYRLTNQ